ncbi:MAG: transcription-repair coupling factor, partial [Spirochaetes bacterium]|nr:transcription-repair coupling factor [Spirochaetota bacterium]
MILENFLNLFRQSADFKDILTYHTEHKPLTVEGISPSSFSLISAALYLEVKQQILVICKNNTAVAETAMDLSLYIPEECICQFPSMDTLPYEFVSPAEKIERERINAIYRILKKDPVVIVASIDALLKKIPGKSVYSSREIELNVLEDYSFDDLLQAFVDYGYERVNRIEAFGEFSVKGGIIDVFPPSYNNPMRLDFFDDTLESIREFDIETQKSIENTDSIKIIPRKEMYLSGSDKENIAELIKKAYINGRIFPENIITAVENDALENYFPGIEDIYPELIPCVPVLSYIESDTPVISFNMQELASQCETAIHTFHELYARKNNKYFTVAPEKLIDENVIREIKNRALQLNTFVASPGSVRPDFKSINSFHGKISLLRDDISARLQKNWKILIITSFEGQARRLSDLLGEFSPGTDFNNPDFSKPVNIILAPCSSGFESESLKTIILTDQDIFGKSYRRKKTFRSKKSLPISSFMDLQTGDYIVHINHGIGIFREIKRMTAGGIEKDFIVIEYADSDTLFVALDQLNMIQRYMSFEGKIPRIDHLGKKSAWNRIKAKVQQDVEEIAGELITIYAKRKALKGVQFPPDTAWQEEFEANFEYEETPDQLAAIEDVKDDMESSQPMDRLVCGDVGFGKTEIAIRAAFKASMAGKQIAILVPTTVLAMQHYNTFKKRFKEYPISIGVICRFRSRSEINTYKAALSAGSLDIIIGTHALLSKDVFFKNLGLLIIDEEQKFGVKHKEQIKKLRSHVDVLTLSATPIPRTLHMSMAGIRDLSIILTPPENRQAVETYVLEDNPDILKMAIERELSRGGQVFYIHNRVQTIDAQAEMVKEVVPEAKIAVAHGQMPEGELEEIMIDFLEGKYDILMSTTIIESGLDMPHVNTIIINRADTFGLSQLYQLKGRVGRSSLKGYAYLFHPRHIALNEIAQKRLRVISEFSELGSGFKIAMKDLEI